MERLQEATENPAMKFGAIYRFLITLIQLFDKVIDYFNAKQDSNELMINEKVASGVLPLFKTNEEPSAQNVGYLVNLKCGHTARPSDQEMLMIFAHLHAAGFIGIQESDDSPRSDLKE